MQAQIIDSSRVRKNEREPTEANGTTQQTGANGTVQRTDRFPFGILYKYKFRVTLNTDDRLMSGITLTDEYDVANKTFGLRFNDLEKLTLNAMKSAFIPYRDRIKLIYDVIKPGFASIRP